ncbi:hypothetical protein [Vibrio diazotrophicus]|uniref:hypothetical protein n=1 Tax=Vibrio diazotrophicus TaxID=685 RepID=UPI00142E82FD|nr:hypothetical protein [Vibrio diazotrophicus]NIY94576.1 hypothetical protein [Vibrio diazotrophicus]
MIVDYYNHCIRKIENEIEWKRSEEYKAALFDGYDSPWMREAYATVDSYLQAMTADDEELIGMWQEDIEALEKKIAECNKQVIVLKVVK